MIALWHACEDPERPVDSAMGWHLGCRACLVKAQAAAAVAERGGQRNARTSPRLVALLEASA